jgi:GNAT superfamily N-acetyltransferase
VVRRVRDPDDPALLELSRLLQGTFADPDTVLELDRIQAFLAEREERPVRQFCVVVAEEAGRVIGGSVFSYVASSNCGFSEYLVVSKNRRGHGLGRRLFDARRTVLDELARKNGHAECRGLFIEADNPERTPPELQAIERETALDTRVRLQIFGHLGFRRVNIDYVQPPLGPGKQPVSYLDLLFAPWDEASPAKVPAEWVGETLCAIWGSWSPSNYDCVALRERLAESPVTLSPIG